jgi:ABC-type multidrug transport system fused ATPase/permease subunit
VPGNPTTVRVEPTFLNFDLLKKTIKNIFVILDRREKTTLGRLIASDVVISILDISFLVALLYIVHFYTQSNHTLPDHSPGSSYFGVRAFNTHPLLLFGVFFLLFALKNWAGYLVLRMQFRFVYGVASRLSRNNLANYMDGRFNDYVNINSAVHIRKINQHPIEFGHYVLGGFQQIISQSLLIAMTVIATLIFNPVLFLLLFIILTPPIFLTSYLIRKKMSTIRKTAKPVSEKTLQHLQEALSGFVESKVYGRKNFFVRRYDAYQAMFNGFLADQQVIQNIPSKLIEVFAVFGFFVLILINTYTGDSNTIQLITIGAFMGAAYKIIPGIVKILNSIGQIRTYAFTASDLLQEQSPTVRTATQNTAPVEGIRSLEFSRVSFQYEDEPVVQNFSMSLSAGELIGLTGISGKGKTTIVNLLLGFAEATSGEISVNGQTTAAAERQRFWKYISYVKQQPFMISDSILRNIVLDEQVGDPARLDELIRKMGLQEFTGIFPEGLNKLLMENGKNISGGQRQRIAFARAMYKKADLVILDEPFNELDAMAELEMLQHCRELAEMGTAILLITHNPKSLSFCHKIISLNEI